MTFTSMLIRKMVRSSEKHPSIAPGGCIKNFNLNISCSACADVCKEKVFSAVPPRYDQCTNCNLCLTVCPTQAILPAPSFLQQIINHMEAEKKRSYIQCHKTDIMGGLNVHCIASIPWELYVVLALDKRLEIPITVCKECEYEEKVTALFNKIEEVMGTEFYMQHFVFCTDKQDEDVISRRELLKSIKRSGLEVTQSVFFDLDAIEQGGLFYRKYLLKKLKSSQNAPAGCAWKTLILNKKCWGCGLCAHICVNHALFEVEDESGEANLIHVPWRCTQCGACKEYCPENGIDGWKRLERTEDLQQKILLDIETVYCPECHKAMKNVKNVHLCYYCGHKANKTHIHT